MTKETIKWALVGLLLIIIEVLLVSTLVRQSWIMENIQEENRKYEHFFGAETARKIREDAKKTYNSFFVNSGIQETSYQMLLPQNEHKAGLNLDNVTKPIFGRVEKSLGTFWATVYQVLTRIQVWMLWLPAALLLLVPSIIDGFTMRKVKVAAHITTSSIRMKYAILTIFISIFILIAALFSPFAVNPLLPLILSLLSAIMISVVLANVQKDI